MKIMSFNTQHCQNFITKEIDFEIMAKTIKDCDADLVGLNEMRGSGPHFEFTAQTEKLATLANMNYFYFAPAINLAQGPYGNGLISKFKIVSAKVIPVPDPQEKQYDGYYETRCLLKAKLSNGLTVMVVHFGLNPDEQENAVKTVLENLESEKCVLMGDFNLKPDNDILKPIYAKMKDTATVFEGERFSIPSDNPNRKIDYIFVTPDVKVISADIPKIIASDHCPHTAEIEF